MKTDLEIKDNSQSLQSCVSVSVTDLRIGNYLEMLGEVRKVECISNLPARKEMYWLTCENMIDTKIIHFYPITITEEWLLKFGFVKSDNDLFELTIKKDDSCISDLWCRSESGLKISLNVFDRNTEEQVDLKFEYLKYVHQLQNFHYILTGSELQISSITEH